MRPRIAPVIWKNTVIFSVVQALNGAGTQLLVALGALTILQLTGSLFMAGLAVTILQGSRLLISYPLGKIADAYGRKPAMVVGLSLSIVGCPLLVASITLNSLALFVIGTLVFGMGIGAAQQLRVAVADMFPADKRGGALGFLLTGSLLGALAGPVLLVGTEHLAGSLQIDNLALPWMALPMLTLFALFLVLRVKPDPKEIGLNLELYWPNHKRVITIDEERFHLGLRSFLKSNVLARAAVCFAPAQGVMAMLMASTPLVLDQHGHSLPTISLAITIHVFGMYGFSLPLGRLADLLGRKIILLSGLVIIAIGATLVPLSGAYFFICLGIFLVGIGWSAVFVATTALIADAVGTQQRGRAIGINDSLAASFSIGLPFLGGVIAAGWGLMIVGLLGSILVLLPLPLLLSLKSQKAAN